MKKTDPYIEFTKNLKCLLKKYPDLITMTLSNIFTMRLIGNKTHGDLAEIAIAEFINQYMYNYRSVHVGKDLYRAKTKEEDIKIINEINQVEFPVSLKAYGNGPLQLSTDKSFQMFPRLGRESDRITDKRRINTILKDPAFTDFKSVNVLPLIYNESKKLCNILIFDYDRAIAETASIVREESGRGRKHPVYRFYNAKGEYICEVRYGDAMANALQRGLWTHTERGFGYFDSLTQGWISYSHNPVLIKLFSNALVSSAKGHEEALKVIQRDIKKLKKESGLPV
jgi:hypothetical protein